MRVGPFWAMLVLNHVVQNGWLGEHVGAPQPRAAGQVIFSECRFESAPVADQKALGHFVDLIFIG